jgi:DNA-binding transcriptional ArsR family regulator
MTEFLFGCADLARMRFGYSPMAELVASVRLLHAPGQIYVYHDWLTAARRRLGDVRMDLLSSLIANQRFVPSFLSPPPNRFVETLADEVAVMTATDDAVVRRELELAYVGLGIPPVLQPLYEDPGRHLPQIADEMDKFWQTAIEPIWPQVRAIALADVRYRLEQFSEGGVRNVLVRLHPDLLFDDTRLIVQKSSDTHADLGGEGVVLAPCVFAWPALRAARRYVGPQALFYPRVALLTSLELPRTTSELAALFNVSPAAISQQLKILYDSSLVDRRRRGRMVFYQRTSAASALLNATGAI